MKNIEEYVAKDKGMLKHNKHPFPSDYSPELDTACYLMQIKPIMRATAK